jgi:hypothetical protein
MQEYWIRALVGQRRKIRRRWESLLRLERAASPIADPDYLVHMIDWTMDTVFAGLRGNTPWVGGRHLPRISELRAGCHCGRNPYLNHFLAGEQALIEALVLAQAAEPLVDPAHRDIAITELYLVLRAVAETEVESLCSLCKNHRGKKLQVLSASLAATA